MGESSVSALKLAHALGKLSFKLGIVSVRLPHRGSIGKLPLGLRLWCPACWVTPAL